jgi:hypothetical protein
MQHTFIVALSIWLIGCTSAHDKKVSTGNKSGFPALKVIGLPAACVVIALILIAVVVRLCRRRRADAALYGDSSNADSTTTRPVSKRGLDPHPPLGPVGPLRELPIRQPVIGIPPQIPSSKPIPVVPTVTPPRRELRGAAQRDLAHNRNTASFQPTDKGAVSLAAQRPTHDTLALPLYNPLVTARSSVPVLPPTS